MKVHKLIDSLLTHIVAWVLCVSVASLFSCFSDIGMSNYAFGTWLWGVYLTLVFMGFLFDHVKG